MDRRPFLESEHGSDNDNDDSTNAPPDNDNSNNDKKSNDNESYGDNNVNLYPPPDR